MKKLLSSIFIAMNAYFTFADISKETIELIRKIAENDPEIDQAAFFQRKNIYVVIPSLMEALGENTYVKQLNLCSCKLNTECVDKIAEALPFTQLTKLDLSETEIGAMEAYKIIENLGVNLTELDLSGNSIGNIGASYIADALKTNTTLTKLRLKKTRITDEGAKKLVEALKENVTLTELDLSENKIKEELIDMINKFLRINETFKGEIDMKSSTSTNKRPCLSSH